MHFRRTPAFVRSMATLPHQVNKRSGSPLRYLLVLDFEATCGDGVWNSEIIEFPTLLYDLRERELDVYLHYSWILNISTFSTYITGLVKATFHEYVKPQIHPQLTPYCTELTGITQVRMQIYELG